MTINRFEERKLVTQNLIQTTFIGMLQTRAFDTITVREIAEEAGIGFKTFYRHYKDKPSLTHAILINFVENLQTIVKPPNTLEAAEENVYIVLAYVRDHAAGVRAIGQMPNRNELVLPIIQFALSEGLKIQASNNKQAGEHFQIQRELIAHHFVHSQLELFFWWASKDLILPLEEMAEMIIKLIIRPIWNI